MSYSIILFSNLIFHFLEVIWTPKIFYNFSNCEILIFQMVKIDFLFGSWLIFQIRNFWNFFNWKFSSGMQNIEWWNIERPGFRNLKITNIKITLRVFFYWRIYFFIFYYKIVKLEKFVIFSFGKWKFPKFNNLENLENFIIWTFK